MAIANINVGSSPGGPAFVAQTPYSSNFVGPYASQHTIKIPVSIVFVTGISLVIVNGINTGQLMTLFALVWDGKEIENPWPKFRTLIGEIMFVLIVSFLSEISASVSDIAFALFIALWMVWAINNTATLNSWTSNIRGL